MGSWGTESDHERLARLRQRAKDTKAQQRPTTLEADSDYYWSMANDTSVPIKQRQQWKELAESVDRRLGRGTPTSEDVELF